MTTRRPVGRRAPHLTRRSLFALVPPLASAALLSACGTDGAPQTGGGATRTVKDVNDQDVVVPVAPQRVITLSEPTTDNAIALGVTPVGVSAGRGQTTVAHYLREVAGDIPVIGTVGAPNLEAIGAARPDLILVDGTSVNNDPDTLAALTRIAPTVVTGEAGGDWTLNLRTCAQALNLADKGEQLLSAYTGRTADVSGRLGQAGYLELTYSIVRWQGSTAGLILKELPAGRVLSDLGMKRPPHQDREGAGHSEPVSMENIDQVDADWMFFGTLGGSSVSNPDAGGNLGVQESAAALESAKQLPGFSALGCVSADHVVPVDGSLWTSTGGYQLMTGVVDDVETAFLTT